MDATSGVVRPPLKLLWRKDSQILMAAAGNGSITGIAADGRVVSYDPANGALRWQTQPGYLGGRLTRQENRLYAYKSGQGLVEIEDRGATSAERPVLYFAASPSAHMSTPVADDRYLYAAVNRGLYATVPRTGELFGKVLSPTVPHAIALVGPGDVVVVNGRGVPMRLQATNGEFRVLWTGSDHGQEVSAGERQFLISAGRLVVSLGNALVGYNLANGRVDWLRSNVGARVLASGGEILYTADLGADLAAVRVGDGAMLWQRRYIHSDSLQTQIGVVADSEVLYVGGALEPNPDRASLMAVSAADGALLWYSRSGQSDWAGGLPVLKNGRLFCYGASHIGVYTPLGKTPAAPLSEIQVNPGLLRGPAGQLDTTAIQIRTNEPARISVRAYQEAAGPAVTILNESSARSGLRELTWNPGVGNTVSDSSQFLMLLIDIEEAGGLKYTQPKLLPINTFPDILRHWARENIEVMAYHRYVNGYLDQTFRPDGLVTRAESSVIVAKTLGLQGPGPGFRSKLTDMANHWSKEYVFALEEKGIVGGFAEPGGTFTFRPDLNMTRAQEARILVKAYALPPASAGFQTHFTDIANHWAKTDILSLESAGYVSGFREQDGTYTYRPERNLTRAEICTVVVRIKKLTK